MLTTIFLIIGGIVLFLICLRFGLIGVFFDILLAILSSSGDSGKSSKSSGYGKGSSGGGGSSDNF